MSLQHLKLKNIYRNSTDKIIDDLVVPLLNESYKYYRGVGFFTSSWIRLVTKGLKSIIENNGKIYLITSPKLSKEDWEAITIGNKAKTDLVLYSAIKRTIDNEFDVNTKYEYLNLFSWLIADGIIELKFAICQNNKGMYHDKIAIFEDKDNNRVCLHGSFNDSLQATYNGESFSLFRSWENGQDEYVLDHYNEFKKMWDNNNSFYNVVDIPDLIKAEFEKNRGTSRPYKQKYKSQLHLPKFINRLNDYQEEAIESIINNNWSGILEMATGTGKTITSLAISLRYLEVKGRLFLIVVVPFNHLVSQWEEVIISFGYKVPVKCNNNRNDWYNNLNKIIRNYNSKITDIECLITTYSTFANDNFQELIKKIKDNVVLIADECHYAGSSSLRYKIPESFEAKIGLSATPDRWYDEEGTNYIRSYFSKTVYEYNMEKAISNGFLTEYNYEVNVVQLTNSEYSEYQKLTLKIANLLRKEEIIDGDSNLKYLILKRAEIISKAKNKIPVFIDQILNQYNKGEIDHTLVYCAKGESKLITKQLSNLGIRVHEFTHTVSNSERKKVLKAFDNGDIEVLVAIKCLDEGVDVPSTKTAYFLSSTSNPREFIQRRGRVLRKYKGKHKSNIIDFIVFPPFNGDNYLTDVSIIEKDMPRFAEFSKYAFNEFSVKNKMRKYLQTYDLEYMIEKLPWEIYNERKEKYNYE